MKIQVPADLDAENQDLYCLYYMIGYRNSRNGVKGIQEVRADYPEAYDAGFYAATNRSMNWSKES